MNRKFKLTIYTFVIMSLFIHVSGVLLLTVTKKQTPPNINRQVEVEFIQAPPEPKSEAVAKKQPPKPKVTNVTDQVVEQKDKINDEVDEKSHLLSAFNQKVIKETRAQNSGKFNNTAKGGKKDDGKKATKPEQKVADDDKEKPEEPLEPGDMPKLKDLSPKFSMDPGPKGADSKENGDPSTSDDYLKDINTGMQTLLSTREFVYYSYYARIKEAIRQHWEPDVREKVKIIYRQGRTIASAKDRVTQLLVVLNAKGELIRVDVLGASGVEQLDAAAVEAFRSASPFPNPPKGMIEPDGTVKIRWDFVLEV